VTGKITHIERVDIDCPTDDEALVAISWCEKNGYKVMKPPWYWMIRGEKRTDAVAIVEVTDTGEPTQLAMFMRKLMCK
jgi:hypothetical protein